MLCVLFELSEGNMDQLGHSPGWAIFIGMWKNHNWESSYP